MNNLVSVAWLSDHLEDEKLILLDCRLAKPKSVVGDESLNGTFIPGARSFDLNGKFSDINTNLPHMMPDEEHFNQAAKKLGISNDSKIVVYDQFGIYSSPRVWWMFKAMGHRNIAVLDGGLPAWISASKSTIPELNQKIKEGNFKAQLQKEWLADASEVLERSTDSSHMIIDARSAGRFHGTEPEPREGLKGGHIPGSKNLPFQEVLQHGKFKSKEDLERIFEQLGVENETLTCTCGSGVTASIILLAAALAGYEALSLYDGSWSEWGQLDNYPVKN
ncbi:MAG: 3-mercaptopyruvate sulfurtransferase [Cyclobacteriaceae bacterium]